MSRCVVCRREIRGTHDDVLVCAEGYREDGEALTYCMPCAQVEIPWAFGGHLVNRRIKQGEY